MKKAAMKILGTFFLYLALTYCVGFSLVVIYRAIKAAVGEW